jgi:hypothetical protein
MKPNETIEAYTGNHVARKGDRTPPGLVYDSLDRAEGRKFRNADGDGVNGSEANTKGAVW